MNEFPLEVDVHQTRAWLHEGKIVLIDVREAEEVQICSIEGAEWIPMRSIPAELERFSSTQSYVIHCHHGGRSSSVTQFLRAQGICNVANMAGGIDAWALTFEPEMNRY